ncbi:hypothetical protein [Bradyrhizobium sp. S3.9.1]|uniref:hypothetical protein n=1 Tax=Bradyrhizobium sp. S3.9.1 TaxID=3156431 RepID=UPI0033980BBC
MRDHPEEREDGGLVGGKAVEVVLEDPAANALELDQPLLCDPLRNFRIQDESSHVKVADSDLQVAGGGYHSLKVVRET